MYNKYFNICLKTFFIFATIILFMIIFFCQKKDTVFAYYKEEIYYENVKESIDLYSDVINKNILSTKMVDGREISIFKDEYCGSFINEDGFLNIQLNISSEGISNKQKSAKHNEIYLKAKYSYNFLQCLMFEIEKIMIDQKIMSVGIDEKNNYVLVELQTNNKQAIIDYLKYKNIYDQDAIQMIVNPNNSINTNTIAYGGKTIFHFSSPDNSTISRGTICVNAYDNLTGKYGIITNEHVACVNNGNPDLYYGGQWPNDFSDDYYIGPGARGQNSGSIDAAFVPFDNLTDWGVTQYGQYNNTYTNVKLGNNNQIVMGAPVFRIGQTTGETYGYISLANYSATTNGTVKTNCFTYSNAGQGGDSGGPVYYTDGINNYLIGCHFCSDTNSTYGCACRISNIMSTLNVTPIVTDTIITTSLTNNKIQISGIGYDISGKIIIPEIINSNTLTSIGNQAFRNQNNMIEIIVPDTLEEIGNRAFQFCYNLDTIDLSETAVTRIEDYTFDTCAMGWFSFPENLTYIGEGAFIRTGDVGSMPDSVIYIGDYAFAYRTNSLDMYLPNDLEEVGDYAFAYSDAYILSNENTSLERIGAYAFYNTLLGFNTKIPASVKFIEEGAFKNSGFANNFALPANSSLLTIGNSAFENNNLKQFIIPSTVMVIGNNAFAGNNNLTIYTEFASQPPIVWGSSWNSSNRPVFWGCTLSSDKTAVLSCVKSNNNPSNPNALNGVTNPYTSGRTFDGWYTTSDFSGTQYMDYSLAPNGTLYVKWNMNSSCIASGSLITLSDGSQVAVESLTSNDELLVWNFMTGQFDSATIMFIDSEEQNYYQIIKLYFSDGTIVKVIDEHAFFNLTLGEYVFLKNDAEQYIGHLFNKQTFDLDYNLIWTGVTLIDVEITVEYTKAWSPVTYSYLCYYVNGLLSMPGATEGLINIFDVDITDMKYNSNNMLQDINDYGLYTYEEFYQIVPIPKILFDGFNGQYLKISIGKGLITIDIIIELINRFMGLIIL